jgi:hypothetical protein
MKTKLPISQERISEVKPTVMKLWASRDYFGLPEITDVFRRLSTEIHYENIKNQLPTTLVARTGPDGCGCPVQVVEGLSMNRPKWRSEFVFPAPGFPRLAQGIEPGWAAGRPRFRYHT